MTAIASFIAPLSITSAMITSNAVSHGASELAWSAATSYTKGTVVYRSTFNRRYECLVSGVNSGLPEDTPLRWYDLGETDQMAMFDDETSTQSIADGTLTVVITPGAFNALFLAGLDGTSITVTIKDAPAGTTTDSYSGSLESSAPDDYYEWCFSPFQPQTDLLLTGLTPYASCQVTIVISNPGGIARCGICAFGDLTPLGKTLQGVSVEPKSYARITTDTRGTTSIRRGKSARDMSVSAVVDSTEFDAVAFAIANILGTPVVVIATDSRTRQSLRVFGLLNGKLVDQAQPILTLTVQGMI